MAFVADNFQRANGPLGGKWGPVNPFVDNPQSIPGFGGIQLLNNAFAPLSIGGEAALCAYTGTTFGNDQWAQAQIAALATLTSVVHITACTSSGGTSVYTYTLTSGSALTINQQIYVAGMQQAGNNSTTGFRITALGVGTFSISNASPGANESGSNGTGTSPADSICGVAVRCSADGKNGYVLQVGLNSGWVSGGGAPNDQRVYSVELWKVVNGVSTYIYNNGGPAPTTIPDSPGDVYALTAVGTTLTILKNGTVVGTVTDSSLSSGSPGIGTWSCGPPGEWASPATYQTGNSGTQWTNFQAGDTNFVGGSGTTQVATSNFAGSGDLVANNPTWSYIGTAAATVGSNRVTPTASGGAKNSAVLAAAQYSQITVVTLANASTQENQGPSICNQNATDRYFVQLGTSASPSPTQFKKSITGVLTTFFAGNTPQFVNGDVVTIFEYNGIVSVLRNGMLVLSIHDVSLSGGLAGYYADVAAADGVMSTWSAGNVTPPAPAPPTPPASAYSVPDCRNYATFPNLSVNVNGTLTYTVPRSYSLRYWFDTLFNRTQPLPVDSRATGAPVDSRANGAPQNSRAPGVFGPDE